ncbi:DUF350 domain-containing protein [Gordonia sp. NPDC003424]
MELLRDNLGHAAAYSILGIVLFIVGFFALDLVTPGRLRVLLWTEHRRNATLLVVAEIIGLAIVFICGINSSAGLALWRGLLYTAIYTILAIAVMMWSFVLVDWLTPGKLGDTVIFDDDHPASFVSAALFLAIGAIVGTALIF